MKLDLSALGLPPIRVFQHTKPRTHKQNILLMARCVFRALVLNAVVTFLHEKLGLTILVFVQVHVEYLVTSSLSCNTLILGKHTQGRFATKPIEI